LQSFGFFETWQGYSFSNGDGDGAAAQQPWFSVWKEHKILKNGRASVVRVAVGAGGKAYRIDGASRGSEYYRVSDVDGAAVAEVGRKRTASGVALGEDVLTLTVGHAADRLLVVGLVVVCGLLSRCI
jgi:hypothetical protein